MTRSGYILSLVILSVFASIAVNATTFVPMSIEELTRSSVATVIGRVEATRSVASPDGHIYTLVDLSVEEVLQGDVPAAEITLREPGGVVGDIAETYDGVPVYGIGDEIVVFLAVWEDGSLRTNQLSLGRWVIDRDASGQFRARQTFGKGVTLIPPPGQPLPASLVSLDDLRAAVDRGSVAPPAVPPGPAAVVAPPEGRAGDGTAADDVSPFVLFGPPRRFFEPDEGITINFLIDDRGDSTLGLTNSRQAVVDALAEWTNVAGASITMANPAGAAGLTNDLDTSCALAGAIPHRVVFDDPHNAIAPPSSCAGVLALGGGCSTPAEQKVFASTTFNRMVKGTVQFANGWNACPSWTQCNVAEVATHELGHVLGLDHSADTDATMFASAHFDARCADVRTDDINGVTFIYPTSTLPTITTASPLPDGTVGMAYNQALTATGGTGSFTWTLVQGGYPGLSLSGAGVISGTPTFTGASSFWVKATDGNGDSHTKQLDISVGPHDSVVLPVKPLTVTLAAGTLSVSKTVKVKVRNADLEVGGHTIQLSATTADCPGGTIADLPDFEKKIAGAQDSVFFASGKTKTAKIPLLITSAAFGTFNHKAPARCTITFTVTSGAVDPNTSNDVVSMELNVIDKNDPEMSAVHESAIKSMKPLTVSVGDDAVSKVKTVKPAAVNADILPQAEDPGHLITVMASDDCPVGTVGGVDYDPDTGGPQNFVTVKGGKGVSGKLLVTASSAGFATPNSKSPQRCTAVLTASGPGGDTDNSNDTTTLVIDVIDKNDF